MEAEIEILHRENEAQLKESLDTRDKSWQLKLQQTNASHDAYKQHSEEKVKYLEYKTELLSEMAALEHLSVKLTNRRMEALKWEMVANGYSQERYSALSNSCTTPESWLSSSPTSSSGAIGTSGLRHSSDDQKQQQELQASRSGTLALLVDCCPAIFPHIPTLISDFQQYDKKWNGRVHMNVFKSILLSTCSACLTKEDMEYLAYKFLDVDDIHVDYCRFLKFVTSHATKASSSDEDSIRHATHLLKRKEALFRDIVNHCTSTKAAVEFLQRCQKEDLGTIKKFTRYFRENRVSREIIMRCIIYYSTDTSEVFDSDSFVSDGLRLVQGDATPPRTEDPVKAMNDVAPKKVISKMAALSSVVKSSKKLKQSIFTTNQEGFAFKRQEIIEVLTDGNAASSKPKWRKGIVLKHYKNGTYQIQLVVGNGMILKQVKETCLRHPVPKPNFWEAWCKGSPNSMKSQVIEREADVTQSSPSEGQHDDQNDDADGKRDGKKQASSINRISAIVYAKAISPRNKKKKAATTKDTGDQEVEEKSSDHVHFDEDVLKREEEIINSKFEDDSD